MTKMKLVAPAREIELIRLLNDSAPDSKSYKRALDELILANTGLIHKIVHRFPIKNSVCSYQDLFHAGIEGLVHGIQKFDVTRGYRLSTYCYRWAQAYVARYFQNHGKTIRIPVHLSTVQMRVKKATEELTRDLGRTPTDAEVASVCDGTEAVDAILNCTVHSLNSVMNDTGEYEGLVGEDTTEEHDYQLECELLLERLHRDVSERDFNMFIHRFGLLGKREHTLSEISDFHGVTRARCHQVSNNCFRLMKTYV